MEVMDKSSLVPSHNATLALEKIRTLSENLSLTDDEIMAIPYTRRFHYRVAQLLHYNTTYGTMDVPYNYKDSKLAKWVQAQRYEHNIYRLELEERKLNIVGASSKLGDPSTPSTFSDASISKKAAIHGIKSHLTRERYELLEHMSFPWISSRAKKSGINQLDGLTPKWNTQLRALERYKDEFGHVRVPEKYVNEEGFGLGVWVKNQRRLYQKRLQEERERILHHNGEDEDLNLESSYQMTNERIQKLNTLEFIWETRQGGGSIYRAQWRARFDQLSEFVQEFNHCRVPAKFEGGLGEWVVNQRIQYRQYLVNGRKSYSGLSQERISLLESLEGFEWEPNPHIRWNSTWWERWDEWKKYNEGKDIEQFDLKNCTPEERSEVKRLQQWACRQRVEYNRYQQMHTKNSLSGKETSMTPERIKAMEEGGFVWSVTDHSWNQRLDELVDFHNRYQTFSVPTTIAKSDEAKSRFGLYDVSELEIDLEDQAHYEQQFWAKTISLGRWATTQRTSFRRYMRGEKQTPRLKGRMERLKAIGFGDEENMKEDDTNSFKGAFVRRGASSEEKEAVWNENFEALQCFKKENKHCKVPPDVLPLGRWVYLQRRKYRPIIKDDSLEMLSSIERERLNRLIKIDFIFSVHEHQWNERFGELKQFKDKHQHLRVPSSNILLYSFIRRQRELYWAQQRTDTKNSLSQNRINALNDIGFVWSPRRLIRDNK
jgi:hypothetical protein